MPDNFISGDRVVLDGDDVVLVEEVVLEEGVEGVKYKVKRDNGARTVVTESRLKLYLED